MNKLLTTLTLAVSCLSAAADNVQTVTIKGQRQPLTVNRLTFSGSSVVLTFADGSKQTVDMADVIITFKVADAVRQLRAAEPADAPTLYFDAKGRQLKDAPAKGTYIMKKGNKVVKLLTK